MQVKRFSAYPIITPALDESIGTNINGPSLLRVPGWLPNPLGKYYLYFAHHQGAFIRLAYADALSGPWTIYPPGTLRLEQTPCYHHIASPDLHVDNDNRRILMYYHGPSVRREELHADPLKQRYPFLEGQRSLLAVSDDGLNFTSDTEIRRRLALRPRHARHPLPQPRRPYQLRTGPRPLRPRPAPRRPPPARRSSLRLLLPRRRLPRAHPLLNRRPAPALERVEGLRSILDPGAGNRLRGCQPAPGTIAARRHPQTCQLRDPGIYQESDQVYLLYSVAGESGIALAELQFN